MIRKPSDKFIAGQVTRLKAPLAVEATTDRDMRLCLVPAQHNFYYFIIFIW